MELNKDFILRNMREAESVYYAINWAEDQKKAYPIRPSKPRLESSATLDQAREYVHNFETYQTQSNKFKEDATVIRQFNSAIDEVIVEYIKEVSGFNTYVPEKSREKVYNLAYREGISEGYYSVYGWLETLVDLFD